MPKRKPIGAILLRDQRCIKCGSLSPRVYAVGCHYVCDKDRCLTEAIANAVPGLKPATVAELIARLRKEFDNVR